MNKINVIRPTLRHKKRYICLKVSNNLDELDKKKISLIFIRNFQKLYGLFSLTNANISVLEVDSKKKTIVIRVNKVNLDQFLSSLFYLNSDFGLIFVQKVSSTIKSLNL